MAGDVTATDGPVPRERASPAGGSRSADGDGGVSYEEFLVWWAEGLSLARLDASAEERIELAATRDAQRDAVRQSTAAGRNNPRASARLSRRGSDLEGFHAHTTSTREGPGRQVERGRARGVSTRETGAEATAVWAEMEA